MVHRDARRASAGGQVIRRKPLVTTAEMAGIFGVSCVTIRRWRQSGKLQAVQVGRELRFRLSDVERLVGEPVGEVAPDGGVHDRDVTLEPTDRTRNSVDEVRR